MSDTPLTDAYIASVLENVAEEDVNFMRQPERELAEAKKAIAQTNYLTRDWCNKV